MVPWGGVPLQKPWLKQNQNQNQGMGGMGMPQQWNAGFGGFGGKNGGAPMIPWRPQWQPAWQQPQWQQNRPRRQIDTVPADFQVDQQARHIGTCTFYHKFKGYGFIELNQKGIIPQDKIFCHWKELCSDDRFPVLSKDLEVECSIMVTKEWRNGGVNTLKARRVTSVGGMNLSLQDDQDAKEKTFVGGQHLRYTGMLKFFTPRHGFGWVLMDEGYDVEPSVPREMRVDKEEVNAAGQDAPFMQNLAVEFGIWKDMRNAGKDGKGGMMCGKGGKGGSIYKVYNMTLPGGHPLTQDALENRISMGAQAFTGTVGIWNWRSGWGFIKVDEGVQLAPRVLAKLATQVQAARSRGKQINDDKMLYFRRADVSAAGAVLRQGMSVSFAVYIDDKGAGASDVRAIGV